mmetsp:Transcript_37288/g.117450  ORF Transcript_37288/g.117450 Transcript_37288/m.117450 type:complete len:163 (+) Transcript_37288:1917-2405(+)
MLVQPYQHLFHELHVLLPSHTGLLQTRVVRIVDQGLCVCSHVHCDGQATIWVDPTARSVQVQLSNCTSKHQTTQLQVNGRQDPRRPMSTRCLHPAKSIEETSPGMPMPYVPRSPKPRILSPSVITTTSTFFDGQFARMDLTDPMSSIEMYIPRGLWKICPYF